MVHVSGDGELVKSTPWSVTRLLGGVFNVISLFFSTLISPSSSSSSGRGNSRGSGSGSGSGFGPGTGLRRQIGRVNNSSVTAPFPSCRSCQG